MATGCSIVILKTYLAAAFTWLELQVSSSFESMLSGLTALQLEDDMTGFTVSASELISSTIDAPEACSA